jgi:energy-coupling factor transporter ATP-binding protein EcfA2
MISKVQLKYFTAFKKLAVEFSPGVNIFIGANGTGKTHILKLFYTALNAHQKRASFEQKLTQVFLPKDHHIGRLAHRIKGGVTCDICIYYDDLPLDVQFTGHSKEYVKKYQSKWPKDVASAVYIPVKEMLADAPGFRSLYEQRLLHIEEVYYDILSKAFLPIPRGPVSQERQDLLDKLQRIMDGNVKSKNEQFFLKNEQGELEFTLLAEGVRKFGLLWLLIQNNTLLRGATLFWDEPEANINPEMLTVLIEILLHLQTQGVQIFIATHSYVVLKEFDLQVKSDNDIRFFSLKRNDKGDIECQTGDRYADIVPNNIAEAYAGLYNKEIQRSLAV